MALNGDGVQSPKASDGIDRAKEANVSNLPITIQGKPAIVSFDEEELFWLNRVSNAAPSASITSPRAGSNLATKADPSRSYLCVPHSLILHSSFIPDSDGGSLLLRLLAPPANVERSATPPFRLLKSRAAQTFELCKQLDKDNIRQPTHRLQALLNGPCTNVRLVKIEARINDPALCDDAARWAEKLMSLSYPDTKPYRKIRVLINPIGGPGKAITSFNSRVRPILDAAGCTVDATITTHAFHGVELAEKLNLQEHYDAIACVSGDGMMHEVLNGLLKRKDAEQAVRIPLVPIPAGSGNAVALNLMGVSQGFNLALATLNAIKGKPMPVDICTVTQPADTSSVLASDESARRGTAAAARRRSLNRRKSQRASVTPDAQLNMPVTTLDASASVAPTEIAEEGSPAPLPSAPALPYDVGYSFLSQAIGLMADVDLGTEHMRMLGDTRFIIGFINGVMVNKECEVDVYVKFGEKGSINKADMRKRVQTWRDTAAAANGDVDGTMEHAADAMSKSNLRHGSVADELPDGPLESIPAIVPLDPSWANSLLAAEDAKRTATNQAEDNGSPDPARWYRIQAPISALYGGKIPFVARDLLQFPFALPQDGCVDLALMLHGGGRVAKLRGIQGAETGVVVYDPAMLYVKCEAYRVVPRLSSGDKRLKKGGLISIDGERKPYRPFQVEVSRAMHMRVLSLFGEWQVPDVAPPSSSPSKTIA